MIQGIIKKWFLEEIFLSLYSTVVSKETFWIVTWYFQFSRPTVTLEVDGIKLDLTIYKKVLLYQQKKRITTTLNFGQTQYLYLLKIWWNGSPILATWLPFPGCCSLHLYSPSLYKIPSIMSVALKLTGCKIYNFELN